MGGGEVLKFRYPDGNIRKSQLILQNTLVDVTLLNMQYQNLLLYCWGVCNIMGVLNIVSKSCANRMSFRCLGRVESHFVKSWGCRWLFFHVGEVTNVLPCYALVKRWFAMLRAGQMLFRNVVQDGKLFPDVGEIWWQNGTPQDQEQIL